MGNGADEGTRVGFCSTVSFEVCSPPCVLMARFYTTYRLMPVIKESVVVIGGPGMGKFYDESDPGFEKPENRHQLNVIRQGRRDSLFLDAIFKVPPTLFQANIGILNPLS